MIKTAVVIVDHSGADTVGLYDRVTVYLEEDDETEVYQIVTTMRQDALHGLVSKESPMGKALLGRRVGTGLCQVNEQYGYYVGVSDPSKRDGRRLRPQTTDSLSGGESRERGTAQAPSFSGRCILTGGEAGWQW